jgi:hypothetical protein
MKIAAAFPSKYLKADDLTGPVQVQIAAVRIENVGTDQEPEHKATMYFSYQGRPAEKGMVLNRTNADTISMDLGDETDTWIGHTIELFKMRVQGPKGPTNGIRLRVLHPTQVAPAAASPFAQSSQPYAPVSLAPGGNIPPSAAFRQQMREEPPLATPGGYGAPLDSDIPF